MASIPLFGRNAGKDVSKGGLAARMAGRTGADVPSIGKKSTKAGRRAERIQQSKQGNGKTVGGVSVANTDDCNYWQG